MFFDTAVQCATANIPPSLPSVGDTADSAATASSAGRADSSEAQIPRKTQPDSEVLAVTTDNAIAPAAPDYDANAAAAVTLARRIAVGEHKPCQAVPRVARLGRFADCP